MAQRRISQVDLVAGIQRRSYPACAQQSQHGSGNKRFLQAHFEAEQAESRRHPDNLNAERFCRRMKRVQPQHNPFLSTKTEMITLLSKILKMAKRQSPGWSRGGVVGRAIRDSFITLNPAVLTRNPVMFTAEVTTLIVPLATICVGASGATTQGGLGSKQVNTRPTDRRVFAGMGQHIYGLYEHESGFYNKTA